MCPFYCDCKQAYFNQTYLTARFWQIAKAKKQSCIWCLSLLISRKKLNSIWSNNTIHHFLLLHSFINARNFLVLHSFLFNDAKRDNIFHCNELHSFALVGCTYSVSNLVMPLQLNWEKNPKNIVKDSEAISPSFWPTIHQKNHQLS